MLFRSLSVDGALADFECGTQVRCRHVRRKRSIAEKIHPPENVNDTARPRSRLPRSEWAHALPTQRPCQLRAPSPGIRNLDACRKRRRSSRQSSHRRAASFLERISSERDPRWSDLLVSTTRRQHLPLDIAGLAEGCPKRGNLGRGINCRAAAEKPSIAGCCARAASGHATAAPPISAMNSPPPHPGGQDGSRSALDAALPRSGHGAASCGAIVHRLAEVWIGQMGSGKSRR